MIEHPQYGQPVIAPLPVLGAMAVGPVLVHGWIVAGSIWPGRWTVAFETSDGLMYGHAAADLMTEWDGVAA